MNKLHDSLCYIDYCEQRVTEAGILMIPRLGTAITESVLLNHIRQTVAKSYNPAVTA